jgi:hypothetical protein
MQSVVLAAEADDRDWQLCAATGSYVVNSHSTAAGWAHAGVTV